MNASIYGTWNNISASLGKKALRKRLKSRSITIREFLKFRRGHYCVMPTDNYVIQGLFPYRLKCSPCTSPPSYQIIKRRTSSIHTMVLKIWVGQNLWSQQTTMSRGLFPCGAPMFFSLGTCFLLCIDRQIDGWTNWRTTKIIENLVNPKNVLKLTFYNQGNHQNIAKT